MDSVRAVSGGEGLTALPEPDAAGMPGRSLGKGRPLDFATNEWLLAGVKTKTHSSVSSRAKARNGRRAPATRLPKFSDAVKRVAGMIEGEPDLSSREGFGPTKVYR